MTFDRIRICDLQSWKGGEVIDLSPSGLTVLKGPSETGKSTLTRFLMRFCTKEKDSGALFDAYVRKGCEQGRVVFEDTKTGENISLILSLAGKFLVYSNGQDDYVDVYKENELNETLFERYGLITDDVNEMVVNVFSRDNPFLGVSTTQLVNGAILDRVLIGRDVERLIDYLKLQESEISQFIKENVIKRTYFKNILNNGRYIDTSVMQEYLCDMRKISTLCMYLTDIEKETHNLQKNLVLESKPVPPKTTAELTTYLQFTQLATSISQEASHIRDVPTPSEVVRPKLTYLQTLHHLLVYIQQMYDNCREIQGHAIPTAPPIEDALQLLTPYQQMLCYLEQLNSHACECNKLSKGLEGTQQALVTAQAHLQTLKEELQVCPLCGSEFGG